jgi:signal transduction histidine kinase/DNA-binding NarL/FixJ family response regulator
MKIALKAAGLLPRSLASRILVLYVISLLSFVVTGVLAFYWYQLHQQVEDAQDIAMMVSEVMSSTVADSAVIGDDDTIKRTLQGAVLRSQFKSGAFIMPNGVGHITVNNPTSPRHASPDWLKRYTATQLFEVNRSISVGGVDYGVLRLKISPDEIAGELWRLTLLAALIGLGGMGLGVLLITRPLSRWLGTLAQVSEIEHSILDGLPTNLAAITKDVPEELHDMFTVLTRTATSLRSELERRENALEMLKDLVKELVDESKQPPGGSSSQDNIEQLIQTISKLMTEREASREALLEAKNAAEEANLAKSRFLATMSHEIRTPMNGVLGMAQVLHSGNLEEEQRRNCVQVLLNSSNTLLTLLNDVLDLSRVEAGRMELRRISSSPTLLAQECASLFNDAARAKQIELKVESSLEAGQHFLIDPVRVRQMLLNLISNAVKFTSKGQVTVAVREVQAHAAGSWLELAVTDTGIGISADQQHLLFKNFSQLDDSSTRSFSGSGLGLSIVRQFTQLMGGQVGLSSQPGTGSRFWIRIPARRSGVEASEPLFNPQMSWSGNTTPRFAGKILLAEDVEANRIVLQAMLERMGLDVQCAGNGREAVDAFTRVGASFDCILMDMRMPELDGLEAAKLIREWESREGRAACPMIAVTANAYEDDRRLCLDAGMNDFLSKPVFLAELEAKLRRWIPATAVSQPPIKDSAARPRQLDEARAGHLARQLLPMLANRLFDSIEAFGDLRVLARKTAEEAPIEAIGDRLNALDFAGAEQALRELADARGWLEAAEPPQEGAGA